MTDGIYIVSSGIGRVAEMTYSTWNILRKSDVVLLLDMHPITENFLESEKIEFKKIHTMYQSGVDAQIVYDKIASEIVTSYNQNVVSVLTDGNPSFMNTITSKAMSIAKRQSIPFYTVTGVSTLDKIFTDIFRDISSLSVSVITGQTLVEQCLAPNTDITLIMQPANVANPCINISDEDVNIQNTRKFLEICYRVFPDDTSFIIYHANGDIKSPSLVKQLTKTIEPEDLKKIRYGTLIAFNHRAAIKSSCRHLL